MSHFDTARLGSGTNLRRRARGNGTRRDYVRKRDDAREFINSKGYYAASERVCAQEGAHNWLVFAGWKTSLSLVDEKGL